jgi:hypothetical protein
MPFTIVLKWLSQKATGLVSIYLYDPYRSLLVECEVDVTSDLEMQLPSACLNLTLLYNHSFLLCGI